MISNRHSADRLADVRAAIRDLEAEAEALRQHLLANPHDRCGSEFRVEVRTQDYERLDKKAALAGLGRKALAPYLKEGTAEMVRCRSLAGEVGD